MARSSPRLSIGLPVFNGEKYLQEALTSLLSQTFSDIEIVICDNASTDRTQEICAIYSRADSRIRYFRSDRNLGAVPNFNRAFTLSTAPLFKWAAHDDLYEQTYLEECIKILDGNEEVVLSHSGTLFIDERGTAFGFDQKTSKYVDPKTGANQRPDDAAMGDSPHALVRFWQVLSNAIWGSHMFGVIRRDKLAQTNLLPNFPGGDRAMLAELALLGRFKSHAGNLYLKRFHENVSWALSPEELKKFLSSDDANYSSRRRQLEAFLSAPLNKPITRSSKAACIAMVAAHSARVATHHLLQRDIRGATEGAVWRNGTTPSSEAP